ncbi:MAG: hypothetical protein WCY62_03615 [Clostridia bacterium]|jgi:hypothetical protein
MKRIIERMILHVGIILAFVIMVLLVLDGFNPTMNFMDNGITTVFLWILCVDVVINAIIFIIKDRRK